MTVYSALKPKELWKLYTDKIAELDERPMKKTLDRCALVGALALLDNRIARAKIAGAKAAKANKAEAVLDAKAEAKAKRQRTHPVSQAVIEALCEISHFEVIATGARVEVGDAGNYPRAELLSVGFDYPTVLKTVRKRFKKSRASLQFLRVEAVHIRAGDPGYSHGELPQKRPRSNEG